MTAKTCSRAPWTACCSILLLLHVIFNPGAVLASSGDRNPTYTSCVEHCELTGCAPWITHNHNCHPAAACLPKHAVPWALWVTQWSCADDCRYHCMLEVERYYRIYNHPAQKYYGKWPFQRVLGMQELASVACSLLNLLAHVLGLAYLWRLQRSLREPAIPPDGDRLPADLSGSDTTAPPGPVQGASGSLMEGRGGGRGQGGYPFMWSTTLCSCCHIIAWTSSAVFHSRDTRTTERIDYCAAITVVYVQLLAAVVRVFALRTRKSCSLALAGVVAGLAWHFHHMFMIKFDYGWNIAVCTGVGIISALLWLVWIIRSPGHPGRWTLLAVLVLGHLALLLELLDFPPKLLLPLPDEHLVSVEAATGLTPRDMHLGLGLVDAHALWHLCTVPLSFMFTRFLAQDIKHWRNPDHSRPIKAHIE